jgi:hypothetical protein
MVEEHSHDRQFFFIGVLQLLVVGPGWSAVHSIGFADFHAFVHQQVSRNNCVVRAAAYQLDLTLGAVIKAASLTLSNNKRLNPTLLQEFPLASAILPDRSDLGINSEKGVIQKTDQELLFQEHFGIVVQYTGCADNILFGLVQAEYFLVWFAQCGIGAV